MRLYDLSIRHKLPLWGAGLILTTALLVAVPFLVEDYGETKRDMLLDSEALGLTLVESLATDLLQGNVQQAQEVVRSPFEAQSNNSYFQFEAILAIDNAGRVFASSSPDIYPVASQLQTHGKQFAQLWPRLSAPLHETLFDSQGEKSLVAIPISRDHAELGRLIIVHAFDFHFNRFLGPSLRSALYTLLALSLLIPLSWYWGVRMARPLTLLANHMDNREGGLPRPLPPDTYPYHDELGQLFRQFNQLASRLQDQERLRQTVLESEHLAMLGKMAAGIAHEVNNPLGGLLTAVDTLKRHGQHDPVTDRIVPLLERGLHQIRDTVSAMLVEVRTGKPRHLSRQDIEDVATIVRKGAKLGADRLTLDNGLTETVALPANLTRQILLNLLLNASQAADHVHALIRPTGNRLVISVDNTGPAIPEEIRDRLFEPFIGADLEGHGLGLWLTSQIVEQLHGDITFESHDGMTRFDVILPLEPTP
jgi:signal transduction histidine kinase